MLLYWALFTYIIQKRKLDTVYYFMRSVSASNAFLSAKESLRAIYNDIIKKVSCCYIYNKVA